MIGLPKGTVKISPYSHEWVQLFNQEKDSLINCLGKIIIDIQHVGSTSVKGLESKPIIDILIGLKKFDDGFKCIEPLKNLNYVYKGSLGKSNRFFFTKGDKKNNTHHVHIVEYGDINWENQILFRDYIRHNPKAMSEYEKLKKHLSKKYEHDREIYTAKKVDFILRIIKEAKNKRCLNERI